MSKEEILKILNEDATYMYPLETDKHGKAIDRIKMVDRSKAADMIAELHTIQLGLQRNNMLQAENDRLNDLQLEVKRLREAMEELVDCIDNPNAGDCIEDIAEYEAYNTAKALTTK